MLVRRISQVQKKRVDIDGTVGTEVQWLFSRKDKTPTYCMRIFTIAPNGQIPCHSHPWEHEIYVLSGYGMVFNDKEQEWEMMEAGDGIYILPNEYHGYMNIADKPDLIFLCTIPNRGDSQEMRYYTLEQLKDEGKICCRECIHSSGDRHEQCTNAYVMRIQPEEMYWTVGGSIIGCKYGEVDEDTEKSD